MNTERKISTVLVFGASGFVGKHLAKEFISAGYRVIGCDRSISGTNAAFESFYQCDLEDSFATEHIVANVNPDIVVNLAAVSSVAMSWNDPALTFRVNVIGAINLLEAVRKNCPQAKVLLIGSSEEYAPSSTPLVETSPISANNPYGISKVAQEHIAKLYADRYGLKIYRTRSFNHIGVGQSPSFVVPSWISQIIAIERSEKNNTLYVGNIEVSRDFSDVRDIVRAYRLLVESEYYGEVFNIGSGHSYLLKDVLDIIKSFSTSKIKVEIDYNLYRPIDNQLIQSNCLKAEQLLDWVPQYSLEESLREVYDSLR